MPEDERPEPPPPQPEQLAYWHPTGTAASPLIICVLAWLAGIIVAGVVGAFFGGFCGVALSGSDNKAIGRTIAAIIAAFWAALAVGCIVRIIKTHRRDRNLPLDLWRRPSRFFAAGFLIGCGLIALIEGICFGTMAT